VEQAVATTATVTSESLLAGLASPDNRTVWQQFVERYRPPIVRFAVAAFGLSPEDAEDAAQLTLGAFAAAYREGQYDRGRARLRSWLYGIARNQIRKTRRDRHGGELVLAADLEQLDEQRADDAHRAEQELWDREWRHEVLRMCLGQVRCMFHRKTLEAFELFAWQGWPASRVAEHLGMPSEAAVYMAKTKVLREIRKLLPTMDGIY